MKKFAPSAKCQLLDQQGALKSYLDALLQPDEAFVPNIQTAIESDTPDDDVSPDAIYTTTVQSRANTDATTGVTNGIDADSEVEDVTQVGKNIDTQGNTAGDTGESKPDDLIPVWARSRFQALTFNIDKKIYATHLNMLAGIIPIPEKFTFIPGQAAWLIGLHRYKQRNIKVFDLNMLLNSGNVGQQRKLPDQSDIGYIVLIGDGRWGFLVSSLGNVLSLEQGDVSWRAKRDKMDYLLATITGNMSILLDLDLLVTGLDKNIYS